MANDWSCVLVRHASAGDARTWRGEDDLRPLDPKGRKQAQALAPLMSELGIERVVSADILRCVQTVEPSAAAISSDIRSTRVFTEAGYSDNPDAALDMFLELMHSGVPTMLCSQGGAIPDIMERCFDSEGWGPRRDTWTKKGAFWRFTFESGAPVPRAIALVPNPI